MTTWDEEEIFHTGEQYFSALLQDISQAQISIDLESYIFTLNTIGKVILKALEEAAARGVRVRVLVDGVGSSDWNLQIIHDLNALHIHARIYRPMPWVTSQYGFLSVLYYTFRIQKFFRVVGRLNRRNHRKVCIIDHRIAYLGGMNVSQTHLKRYAGNQAWRDTSLKVVGRSVEKLQDAFQHSWEDRRPTSRRLWMKRQHHALNSLIRLNNTRERRRRNRLELLERILSSSDRVWITTPYFIPDLTFIRALKSAAKSGTDVRILLPSQSDIRLMGWANRAFYPVLLAQGIRIFEYLPTILHAKIVIIDDWITIGSSNRNHRSLFHDLEVDVVVTKLESLQSVISQFHLDTKNSEEITLRKWQGRSLLFRLLERLILYIKYWL